MRIVAAVLLISLAGCTTEPPAPELVPAPPPQAAAPQTEPDQCGAGGLQAYVGRPRTEIPPPVTPGLRRVACTTCAAAMDFNPRRVSVFFDAATGLVTEIRCG